MDNSDSFYKKHIFCCINERDSDSSRPSCGNANAYALAKCMKKKCKSLGIENIRVNTSSCLNRCELGPVMVIYPDSTWYHYETEADIDKIIEQHIINNKLADELILKNNQ